ncbi:MAG: MATE family efflux transporter [Planctomycetales bacterium]|nr:MATE family efflux transporter [Planctomycetales bacterium]
MISAGFVSLTLFADRTLLYWHSEAAASAAMGAGAVYWSMICLPMGMLGYLSTFVSQYRGAQQVQRIGVAYQHALAVAWCLVPVLLLAIALAWTLFAWAEHSPQLIHLEAMYLRVLLVGGIGVLFYSVQSGLLTGQGRTGTVLAIDGVATLVNLPLNVLLIFGLGPIPPLGILGAGLATTLSFWLKIPLASWVIARDRQLSVEYRVGVPARWEAGMFRRLITYGMPAGLQMLAEASCFSVIMLQVGRMGELAMAATTLALGLNVLVFVPMIGLGIGVGVLVGQHLTEGRIDLARRTVSCALGVTALYSSIFAAALGLAPEAMVALYAWGAPSERFEVMRPLLLPLLKIIAFYCVVDGLQVVFVGAVKGAGDTWFVLLATVLISLGTILIGLQCQQVWGPSLALWWYVIAGWVAAMGSVFATRYFSGRWESKRVIERANVDR